MLSTVMAELTMSQRKEDARRAASEVTSKRKHLGM